MIVRTEIDPKTPLTPEEEEMLNRAAKMPAVFDEDCPEFTVDELKNMRKIPLDRHSRNR